MLDNARSQISKYGVIAPKELGKGVGCPEGLRVWLLRKREISSYRNMGLPDYELMTDARCSQIVK